MKTILNSYLGVLLMALAGSGCTAVSVGFDRDRGNPPFARAEHDYPRDGAQQGDVFRACFDGRGALTPDPADPDGDALRTIPERINRRCRDGRPLVVLVHGCNNTYPEARRSYHLARLVLREQLPTVRPVFLEIYWDALSGDPLAVWETARQNSLWVGLGLRRLLSGLDPDLSVRVIAHSRGTALVCSALWNLPLRERRADDRRYAAAAGNVPVRVPADLQIALLAPAMGPEDLAAGGAARSVRRVLVGINEDDPAVGKGFLPATWFGDTSLGCTPEVFRDIVAPAFGARARAVDFSTSVVHDFKDYLLRRAFLEEVLPDLFGAPAAGDGAIGGER